MEERGAIWAACHSLHKGGDIMDLIELIVDLLIVISLIKLINDIKK